MGNIRCNSHDTCISTRILLSPGDTSDLDKTSLIVLYSVHLRAHLNDPDSKGLRVSSDADLTVVSLASWGP